MDIVVTIPKREYKNDDQETFDFLNSEGSYCFWVMNKYPKKLEIRDRVHFVKNGRVESSMRVVDIRERTEEECATTGRVWYGICIIYMDDLQYHTKIIEARGFQGFRYKWWKDSE